MSLPGASEKHGSVGLLVRDVETKVIHEHVRCVVYLSFFFFTITVHGNHATVEVLLITRIVIEIGVEQWIDSRASEYSIRLHVEVHGHILHSFLGCKPCGDVCHSLVMSHGRESDVIGIADGFQLTALHTLHQIILPFRHDFPSNPHPLSLKNTVHHTVLLQNNDPSECD